MCQVKVGSNGELASAFVYFDCLHIVQVSACVLARGTELFCVCVRLLYYMEVSTGAPSVPTVTADPA